jgi:tRNA A58 N-methylase Trm61
LDLYNFGYHDITAFDYSSNAIERQEELLSYSPRALEDVTLLVRDGRDLDEEWTDMYDIIFEKGALDAIFLSGVGNVEKSVEQLKRVIKKGGYMMSVSGVIPETLRREMFSLEDWEWVRDGTDDLKAGCFVWRRI